jgi:hypothetical protein
MAIWGLQVVTSPYTRLDRVRFPEAPLLLWPLGRFKQRLACPSAGVAARRLIDGLTLVGRQANPKRLIAAVTIVQSLASHGISVATYLRTVKLEIRSYMY